MTKTLPLEIQKDGFTLKQVRREGDLAVYSKSKEGKTYAFEVIRIRTCKPNPLFKSEFDLWEIYPRSRDWGKDGFTATSMDEVPKYWALLIPGKPSKTTMGARRVST